MEETNDLVIITETSRERFRRLRKEFDKRLKDGLPVIKGPDGKRTTLRGKDPRNDEYFAELRKWRTKRA